MRRIFCALLVVCFVGAVGCRKDVPASPGKVSGRLEYYSSCKSKIVANDLSRNDSLTILYSYNESQKHLQVIHVNAVLNSDCDSMCCSVANVGNRIAIDEMELMPRSSSLGYFNMRIEIDDVEPTSYMVTIREPDSSNKEEVVFTIDLETKTEGMLKFPLVYRSSMTF